MSYFVEHTLNRCHDLWEMFSPKNSVFDTWDFRYSFWLGYQHRPHFIVLSEGNEIVGMLPLWYESDKEKYFWFGSWWQEDNTFFVKDSKYIRHLLSLSPTPLHINAITSDSIAGSCGILNFWEDDPKFILRLQGMRSAEDFLITLNSKKRYNIRRDCKLIESQHPEVIFDRFDDFDNLIELSKRRFAQKGEETDWEDPRRIKTFREVIRRGLLKDMYTVRMITVVIKGKIAAVDLITMCNGTYAPLKCGYDVRCFPGIGNFVNVLEINDAIRLGMEKIDFLEVNYGWKDKWFESVPLFYYEK